jgi:putative ABC transport system permease protein
MLFDQAGGNDMHDRLAAIEKVWSRYFPQQPFSYFYLNDYYSQQYGADEQFGKTFMLVSAVAKPVESLRAD